MAIDDIWVFSANANPNLTNEGQPLLPLIPGHNLYEDQPRSEAIHLRRTGELMNADLTDVELGFVVNLGTLREALTVLNVNGRRWWIASDPYDAVETGYLSIGHGDALCIDRLNTLYFKIPILGNHNNMRRTERLLLLFDPSTIRPESQGFYLENGRLVREGLEDFNSFYNPIKTALIACMKKEG